ncbi:glycoside hydrolase family 2 protein [Actinokineospora soli]|uniref:Glycoside hydrolase family 2 protein n=1 Tax=Actinokineospora soli TaxID=1048753 RepID=A0ABW2TJZ6_9PSEU
MHRNGKGHTAKAVVRPGETTATLALTVPDAPLWWPTGYGDQPLHDLDVTLDTGDSYHRRIGFRTITVDTTPDEIGTPFTFVVNGKPVFAKGANWIPDDHFLTRITRDQLARRVDQAVAANLNMLRVWGGGIYETEDFYDVCDERGVLVWQDFPFACASYPEEEPLWSEVAAEAREHVARLTPHPSLALWNGNNENLWGHADWGWPEQLQGKTWGLRYYTELLPAIVAELDPTRPYSPGSPHSPGDVHPNDADHGPRHEWEVWNRVDYTRYRDHVPRFCAEFGFQGPPAWSTLVEWVRDDPMTPTSPASSPTRRPRTATSSSTAASPGTCRSPRRSPTGTGRPSSTRPARSASPSSTSGPGGRAPRRAGLAAQRLLAGHVLGGDRQRGTAQTAVLRPPAGLRAPPAHRPAPRRRARRRRGQRHRRAVDGELAVRRLAFSGDVLAEAALPLDVAERAADRVDLPPVVLAGADTDLLVVTAGDVRAVHTFAEDIALPYAADALAAEVSPTDDGYRVRVTASAFARDVALLADRAAPDAVVDDALVTLLPGESHTFHVRTAARLDPAALTAALLSANALCAAAVRS